MKISIPIFLWFCFFCTCSNAQLNGVYTHMPLFPVPRYTAQMLRKDDALYLLGGVSPITSADSIYDDVLADLWKFNLTTKIWIMVRSEFDNYPKRQRAAWWFLPDGTFFFFGGFDNNAGLTGDMYTGNYLTSVTVAVVNMNNNAPSPRMNSVVWIHNETTLGLVGGQSGTDLESDLWFFNIVSRTWFNVPTSGMPPLSSNTVKVGDYYAPQNAVIIYIVRLREIWKLDLTRSQWVSITTTGPRPDSLIDIAMHIRIGNNMFIVGGSSTSGFTAEVTSYNIDTNTWVEYADLPEATSNGNLIEYKGDIYLFGGQTMTGAHNGISRLVAPNFRATTYTAHTNVPPPRKGHSVTKMGDSLIMFGGLGDTIFRDLWKIDQKLKWTRILTATEPPPRFGHLAWALNEFLFICGGGTSPIDIMSDFWSFSLVTMDWQFLGSTTNLRRRMNAHVSTYVTTDTATAILFGGRLTDHFSNDLWYFEGRIWDRYIPVGAKPPGLENSYVIRNDTHVFLMGGILAAGTVNTDLWVFDPDSKVWKSFPSALPFSTSDSYKISITQFRLNPIQVFIAEIPNDTGVVRIRLWTQGQDIDISKDWDGESPEAVGALTIYDRKLVFVGGTSNENRGNANIDTVSLSCGQSECFLCPEGTYKGTNGVCTFCPAGTYNPYVDQSECTPCPQGTFCTFGGATALSYCIPCKAKTFNNYTGRTSCFPCSEADQGGTLQCVAASVYPHLPVNPVVTYSESMMTDYSNRLKLDYLTDVIGYTIAVVCFCLIAAFLAIAFLAPKLNIYLLKADFLCWDNHIEMYKERFVLSLKTPLGGMFSIMLTIVTFLLIIAVICRPIVSNTNTLMHIVDTTIPLPKSTSLRFEGTFVNSIYRFFPDCRCNVATGSLEVLSGDPTPICKSLPGGNCSIRWSAIVETSRMVRETELRIETNVAPQVLVLNFFTDGKDNDIHTYTAVYPRTQHNDAKLTGSVIVAFDILATRWRSAKSIDPAHSAWNIRHRYTVVQSEELVVADQTTAFQTMNVFVKFRQLSSEIEITERERQSIAFMVAMVFCVCSGCWSFGLALFRIIEMLYYWRNPSQAPWIRHYLRGVLLKKELRSAELRRLSQANPGMIQALQRSGTTVYIPRQAQVQRISTPFEVADTETLRQNLTASRTASFVIKKSEE